VNAEIHVLTGARTGLVSRLVREGVLIGRHPECALQLHPTLDLEVSTRHAEIVRSGDRWFIRDLDSRNGTFVNGRRISGETLLWKGDRVLLGMTGPTLEFHLPGLPRSDAHAAPRELAGAAAGVVPSSAGEAPDPIRSAARQNRRLRWLSASMAVMLLTTAVLYRVSQREQRATWERERLVMQQRIDSVLIASESSAAALEGMLGGLSAAVRRSQDEIREINDLLRRTEADGSRSQLPLLRDRLENATVALDRQRSAAALDFRSIELRNRSAVAKVFVEYEDGEVAAATAFAVRADATLLTSRHVVAGADGRRGLRRLAVQFSDSEQVWPARVLLLDDDADLALVKVDNIVGGVPTIQALNLGSDTVAAGAPVALIGYPGGGQTGVSNGAPQVARPVLSAAVVTARRLGRFELQGYGAAGASGSPVFDGNGEVIGVLFGGRRDANGNQTLYSVPSTQASRLLQSVP
jgi:S1-C subfamily serine protease